MSDHEFEKQVRQKLNDLRLTPSASAWQKIEDGIRQGRRRRIPLLWLPVLLLGLTAGGYLFVNRDQAEGRSKMAEGKTEMANVNGDQGQGRNERADVKSEMADVKGERAGVKSQTADVKSEITDVKPQTSNGTVSVKRETTNVIQLKPVTKDQLPASHVTSITSAKSISETKTINYHSTLLSTSSPFKTHPIDVSLFDLNNKNQILPGLTSPVVTPVVIPRKKWSFGVTGFAGVSGLNNGDILNLNKALTADVTTPSNAAFAPSYTPYRVVPGFSFAAGLTVKRELTSRFHLTAGINYLQMNFRYKPGNQVYGSQAINAAPLGQYVRNYFQLAQHIPDSYKNTYHFAEIPVTLHTRITNSRKLPVFLNTGLSYSRLLNSNSKQFDGSTGVYYSNEKLLNKSQVAVITGVDFVILQRTRFPLWVGPMAKYNVTRLTNDDLSEKKNILSAGINMKVFLK